MSIRDLQFASSLASTDSILNRLRKDNPRFDFSLRQQVGPSPIEPDKDQRFHLADDTVLHIRVAHAARDQAFDQGTARFSAEDARAFRLRFANHLPVWIDGRVRIMAGLDATGAGVRGQNGRPPESRLPYGYQFAAPGAVYVVNPNVSYITTYRLQRVKGVSKRVATVRQLPSNIILLRVDAQSRGQRSSR